MLRCTLFNFASGTSFGTVFFFILPQDDLSIYNPSLTITLSKKFVG